MAELNIRFDVKFSQPLLRGILCFLMLAGVAEELGADSVTLTTYYPAPSGVYTNMITTGDTYLARDGGNVIVGGTASAGPNAITANKKIWFGTGGSYNVDIAGVAVLGHTDVGGLNVKGNMFMNGSLAAIGGGAYSYWCSGSTNPCPCTVLGVHTYNPLTGLTACPAGFFKNEYKFADTGANQVTCFVMCWK
ncbi:MAG: hypothetical protein COV48_02905 [Elusimicrobia bacterium CG11_big_fil_rev_8_21_14_0_20_64_6]|nr:MAG: hypothetical protein COV48_02905 [Elusimicrobia bacterium CG11_big_fil_rev_8_21_14_0_20_64_6]